MVPCIRRSLQNCSGHTVSTKFHCLVLPESISVKLNNTKLLHLHSSMIPSLASRSSSLALSFFIRTLLPPATGLVCSIRVNSAIKPRRNANFRPAMSEEYKRSGRRRLDGKLCEPACNKKYLPINHSSSSDDNKRLDRRPRSADLFI